MTSGKYGFVLHRNMHAGSMAIVHSVSVRRLCADFQLAWMWTNACTIVQTKSLFENIMHNVSIVLFLLNWLSVNCLVHWRAWNTNARLQGTWYSVLRCIIFSNKSTQNKQNTHETKKLWSIIISLWSNIDHNWTGAIEVLNLLNSSIYLRLVSCHRAHCFDSYSNLLIQTFN